ncbi:MBL fold metallo-hydrolase [Vreelandella nanhaiensis]|nr:MBL fold metallo-hydrolase [Halomonas nanhaiensis]
MDGQTRSLVKRGHLTCHCLLLEADHGLILVDTGLGLEDVRNPKSQLSGFFLAMVSPDFREEMTAVRQVESLGFNASDVHHIVLTHLDFDHAGGLNDFPHATVHMLQEERDYALKQRTWLDRQRFRPQQWPTEQHWRLYGIDEGEDWFGFFSISQLEGVPNNIRLVPLPGHTHGHCGVAIKLADKWLLQTGDAYFYHQEMDPQSPFCTPGLRFYQTLMEKDRQARLNNQQRLRELSRAQGNQIELFCAHDVVEFERLSGRSARVPVQHLRL